jgi:hypothetical protein
MMARRLQCYLKPIFFGEMFYVRDRSNDDKRSNGARPRRPHAVR